MSDDEQDALMAAQSQHEQELLQQDPAFLLWLQRLDADTQWNTNRSSSEQHRSQQPEL